MVAGPPLKTHKTSDDMWVGGRVADRSCSRVICEPFVTFARTYLFIKKPSTPPIPSLFRDPQSLSIGSRERRLCGTRDPVKQRTSRCFSHTEQSPGRTLSVRDAQNRPPVVGETRSRTLMVNGTSYPGSLMGTSVPTPVPRVDRGSSRVPVTDRPEVPTVRSM